MLAGRRLIDDGEQITADRCAAVCQYKTNGGRKSDYIFFLPEGLNEPLTPPWSCQETPCVLLQAAWIWNLIHMLSHFPFLWRSWNPTLLPPHWVVISTLILPQSDSFWSEMNARFKPFDLNRCANKNAANQTNEGDGEAIRWSVSLRGALRFLTPSSQISCCVSYLFSF